VDTSADPLYRSYTKIIENIIKYRHAHTHTHSVCVCVRVCIIAGSPALSDLGCTSLHGTSPRERICWKQADENAQTCIRSDASARKAREAPGGDHRVL
jgi:hypothetical protein